MGKTERRTGGSFAGGLFWAIMIFLFLLSLSVVVTLFFRLPYYLDIRLLDLPERSGRSVTEIRAAYDAMIDYMAIWNRGSLTIPGFAMSEHGRIHFEDCKEIFDLVQILFLASGIFTAVSFVRHRKSPYCGYLRAAGILSLIFPALILSFALLSWEKMFILFHRVFFRNDYWLFDSSVDPVILILPDSFFLQCALEILLIVLIGAGICLARAERRKIRISSGRRTWSGSGGGRGNARRRS